MITSICYVNVCFLPFLFMNVIIYMCIALEECAIEHAAHECDWQQCPFHLQRKEISCKYANDFY